jgi:hypothetical protein
VSVPTRILPSSVSSFPPSPTSFPWTGAAGIFAVLRSACIIFIFRIKSRIIRSIALLSAYLFSSSRPSSPPSQKEAGREWPATVSVDTKNGAKTSH